MIPQKEAQTLEFCDLSTAVRVLPCNPFHRLGLLSTRSLPAARRRDAHSGLPPPNVHPPFALFFFAFTALAAAEMGS